MEHKYQIIALVGRSGAGKDTIQNATCQMHPSIFHKIISCTSRPKREGEVQGLDYNFVTLEHLTRKVLAGDMLEATEFNNWFYGTMLSALDKNKINIGVFNPTGAKALLKDPRLNVLILKVDTDEKSCLMRALQRENFPDCNEICRRFMADTKDLAEFARTTPEYGVISNPDGACLDLLGENNSVMDWVGDMWAALENGIPFASAIKQDIVYKSDEGNIN